MASLHKCAFRPSGSWPSLVFAVVHHVSWLEVFSFVFILFLAKLESCFLQKVFANGFLSEPLRCWSSIPHIVRSLDLLDHFVSLWPFFNRPGISTSYASHRFPVPRDVVYLSLCLFRALGNAQLNVWLILIILADLNRWTDLVKSFTWNTKLEQWTVRW